LAPLIGLFACSWLVAKFARGHLIALLSVHFSPEQQCLLGPFSI
jgi:hypothetical protein